MGSGIISSYLLDPSSQRLPEMLVFEGSALLSSHWHSPFRKLASTIMIYCWLPHLHLRSKLTFELQIYPHKGLLDFSPYMSHPIDRCLKLNITKPELFPTKFRVVVCPLLVNGPVICSSIYMSYQVHSGFLLHPHSLHLINHQLQLLLFPYAFTFSFLHLYGYHYHLLVCYQRFSTGLPDLTLTWFPSNIAFM